MGALGPAAAVAPAVSDERLKTNIKKVGELASGLGVYTWAWTKEAVKLFDPKYHIGVIAQEVQKVLPEAVVMDETGYLKVDYARLV